MISQKAFYCAASRQLTPKRRTHLADLIEMELAMEDANRIGHAVCLFASADELAKSISATGNGQKALQQTERTKIKQNKTKQNKTEQHNTHTHKKAHIQKKTGASLTTEMATYCE